MLPLIVVRPEPGCAASVRSAGALGLDASGFPLFAVQPMEWPAPSPDTIDALLIGSANALRHGGPQLALYRGKPTYAVGQTTAEACTAAGLDVVAVGSGGLQGVMARLAAHHRRLLRLSGRERIELALPPGHMVLERTVYDSVPVPMTDALAARLRSACVVALHSAEAARHFAAECDRRGVDRSRIALAVIGPRVVVQAGLGWRSISVAESPSAPALLALAQRLCQEPPITD